MNHIALTKQQSKTIAKQIYPDIKHYCLDNFERYFPWLLDDIRKSKGKPPLKTVHVFNRRVK